MERICKNWKKYLFPVKYSNVQLARIQIRNTGVCTRCFPHGIDTDNSTLKNNERTWKRQRKTQYKIKEYNG